MFKKIFSCVVFVSASLAISGCEYLRERTPGDFLTNPFAPSKAQYARDAARMQQNLPNAPQSIVVCRSHQCAPAKLSMTKEYIYNSLLQLFDNNNYQKALICKASSNTHTCLENYITIPLTAGITPTNAYIDYVRITDVIIGNKATKFDVILNYHLTYGGQTPACTPSKSIIFTKNTRHVLLEDSGYTCKMSAIGSSIIKTIFAIDYIDLDYGYIGGYYSIGISGPSFGGNSGYMLLRLPKNAYPLSPALKAPTQKRKNNSRNSYNGTNTNSSSASITASDSETNNYGQVQIFPLDKK